MVGREIDVGNQAGSVSIFLWMAMTEQWQSLAKQRTEQLGQIDDLGGLPGLSEFSQGSNCPRPDSALAPAWLLQLPKHFLLLVDHQHGFRPGSAQVFTFW